MKERLPFILSILGIVIIASTAGAEQKVDEKTVSPNAYEYNAKGRRDPFTPLIVKVEPDRKKGGVPLENYGVNEFKVTAVLIITESFMIFSTFPPCNPITVPSLSTKVLPSGVETNA